MKKILVLLGILLLVGGGVGYTMYKDSNKVSLYKYGGFTTTEGKTSDFENYVESYNQFQSYLKLMNVYYISMRLSPSKVDQFNYATSYVEVYIELQEEISDYNHNVAVPTEFKKLHESLIREIGYTDLISEEFGDAIESENFDTVEELIKLQTTAHKEGLASTDMIEYRKSEEKFHLND